MVVTDLSLGYVKAIQKLQISSVFLGTLSFGL